MDNANFNPGQDVEEEASTNDFMYDGKCPIVKILTGWVCILWVAFRGGYRISVRGGRDFLVTKLFSGIRNKIREKRYKTHKV